MENVLECTAAPIRAAFVGAAASLPSAMPGSAGSWADVSTPDAGDRTRPAFTGAGVIDNYILGNVPSRDGRGSAPVANHDVVTTANAAAPAKQGAPPRGEPR